MLCVCVLCVCEYVCTCVRARVCVCAGVQVGWCPLPSLQHSASRAPPTSHPVSLPVALQGTSSAPRLQVRKFPLMMSNGEPQGEAGPGRGGGGPPFARTLHMLLRIAPEAACPLARRRIRGHARTHRHARTYKWTHPRTYAHTHKPPHTRAHTHTDRQTHTHRLKHLPVLSFSELSSVAESTVRVVLSRTLSASE